MRKAFEQLKNLFYPMSPKPHRPESIQPPLMLTVDLQRHEKDFINGETRRLLLRKVLHCRVKAAHRNWPALLPLMPTYAYTYAWLEKEKPQTALPKNK